MPLIRRRQKPTCVYFMALSSGLIKIGSTQNINVRARQIDGQLIGYINGNLAVEREIQKRFRALAVMKPGERGARPSEWFRPSMELLNFIGSLHLQQPLRRSQRRAMAAMWSHGTVCYSKWAYHIPLDYFLGLESIAYQQSRSVV